MRLAIDTSANLCAACVYQVETSQVLSSQSRDIGRGHAEVLMEVIGECIQSAAIDYSQLTSITVTIGPGSFTGVRVGMATARGLALSLGIPLRGISTLESCARFAQIDTKIPNLVTLIDAKRGEAYCTVENGEAFLASYERLAEKLTEDSILCGSGAEKLNALLDRNRRIIHQHGVAPIEAIAAMDLGEQAGVPEPLYLRGADAKPQAGFILPRVV